MKVRSARHASVSVLGLTVAAGFILVSGPRPGTAAPPDQYSHLPGTIRLGGMVRDFRACGTPGGHADFESFNTGHRVGVVTADLDEDGKPRFHGQGQAVATQFRDRLGLIINPALFDPSRGDVAGVLARAPGNAVSSEASMAQWFRDVPGVNRSKPCSVDLNRQPGTSVYTFVAEDDPNTSDREGFFPADGCLFNDPDATFHHNYHFTFEASASFAYRLGTGQVFTFLGDGDVCVFIAGRLAIDLGGVHGSAKQTVDLDRFADRYGLRDGQRYPLRFFLCQRHTTRSSCRIDTTLTLAPADVPGASDRFK